MEANVGGIDKILRISLGLIVILTGWLVFHSWWALIGILFLFSGMASKCFVYNFFGFSTKKKK
ncbi:MAG: DUF2892 domain-containing protein [Bacteroidetes bacterium]|nr:DUF2892 domain-containing protein [Bacteroidota bacterium]